MGIVLSSTLFSQTVDEYRVKAAFLYNFAKFVEWPALTDKTGKNPLRICVLGQDPFGSVLGDTVNGKTVLGRPFLVTNVPNVSQAATCQILFISASEQKRIRSIIVQLRTPGVLTVGETEGFANQGGIVNFKLESGRVRLEINVEAAEQAKLRISSKVLSLAQIVKTEAAP
jgi:hypothetical protein